MRHLRNVEVYVAAALAAVFAVLSVIGDIVPVDLRWAALLAAVALLVYRSALETRGPSGDELLGDRVALQEASPPLAKRLETARTVWLFAPSAVNFLTPQVSQALRHHVLSRPEGSVRVVVLDPAATDAVAVAEHQLDDSLDAPLQRLRPSLDTVLRQLGTMDSWPRTGTFEYRVLPYNPGFSLLAVDPGERDGWLVLELHGIRNEAVTSRMHLRLTRRAHETWHRYWLHQYEHLWHQSRPLDPTPGTGPAAAPGPTPAPGPASD
ncbi:hypothetical protein ACFY3J_12680 [Streptomyces sp. NPDC001231]|uniref:hypothetical protein n=1 Tax=unclassified Streptomyces TaxID=2593676 RepID=UPI003695F567